VHSLFSDAVDSRPTPWHGTNNKEAVVSQGADQRTWVSDSLCQPQAPKTRFVSLPFRSRDGLLSGLSHRPDRTFASQSFHHTLDIHNKLQLFMQGLPQRSEYSSSTSLAVVSNAHFTNQDFRTVRILSFLLHLADWDVDRRSCTASQRGFDGQAERVTSQLGSSTCIISIATMQPKIIIQDPLHPVGKDLAHPLCQPLETSH